MSRFIDLDEIAPPPVRVRIAGVDYKLPGDVPVPEYIALDELSRLIIDSQDDDELGEVFEDLADRLLTLFQIHQPDLEGLPCGPRLLLPLVLRYLNGTDANQPDPEATDAVPPPQAGTKTKRSTARRPAPKTTTRKRTSKATVS